MESNLHLKAVATVSRRLVGTVCRHLVIAHRRFVASAVFTYKWCTRAELAACHSDSLLVSDRYPGSAILGE